MILKELKALLKSHPDKAFRLRLPSGALVPGSFHITEVGRVRKTFLDCGGKLHESELCQLQVWVGEDENHRIESGKMAGILDKAASFLPDETVPLEIEYEEALISQYTVGDHAVTDGAVVLHLAYKHTACLAMELCGAAAAGVSGKKESDTSETCFAGAGCC